MDNNKNIADLKEKRIGPLLAKLAIPATIGMLSNSLYSIVDTIFIGRGVGTLAIAGVGIVFPIHMIIMAIAQLIGLGSASVISRSLGKKDYERAGKAAGNSFLAVILLGVIATAVTFSFIDPILRLFGATENILPFARDYLFVIAFGFMIFPFLVSSNSIIRAEGAAKTSMFIMILATGSNIILDPIFIFVFKLGIRGAAIATVISQFAGFIFVLVYYLRGKSVLSIRMHHLKPDFSVLKEMFNLGLPSFIRMVSSSFLIIIINNLLNFYSGDLGIAIYSVVNRIVMFISMPFFGVGAGVQPIIGFNYGARNNNRVKEVLKISITIATIVGAVFFILIMVFPDSILAIFSKDTELIKNGVFPLRMVLLFFPIIGFQVIGATFFQSIGKAIPSIFLSMSKQAIFLIPLILILPIFMDAAGIWIAFPIADFMTIMITALFLKKEINTINKLEQAVENAA